MENQIRSEQQKKKEGKHFFFTVSIWKYSKVHGSEISESSKILKELAVTFALNYLNQFIIFYVSVVKI